MASLGHCYVCLSCARPHVITMSVNPQVAWVGRCFCQLAYTERHLKTALFHASWVFLLGGVFHYSPGQILTADFSFLATVALVEGRVGVRPAQM